MFKFSSKTGVFMNFCAIICEFNPFHNGHEHIIQEAKKITGKDIICLMSGNFVQRGTPAILDKYTRAKHAIMAGANAVLELPCIYACSNAENFATGAIRTLKALGIDTLAFGIEHTSLEILQKIAKLKFENSERFKTAFKNEIENGINYNTALKRSIASTLDDDGILEILNKPNNVLAIEYLTAILTLDANITPIAIERTDNGFVSKDSKNQFLSASSIRELVIQNKSYQNFIPSYANITNYFDETNNKIFESLTIHTLRTSSPSSLEKCYDYNEGIEFRVKKMADEHSSLADIVSNVSSPRYRISRVNKLVLYPLLGITKKVQELAKTTKPVCKVLAIQKQNKSLISNYNKRKINLIVTNKDYECLNRQQKQIINIDLTASNIYACITNKPNNQDKKIGTLFI